MENRRFAAATLLDAGNPPIYMSNTTAVKKFFAGTVIIPLPNGKKFVHVGNPQMSTYRELRSPHLSFYVEVAKIISMVPFQRLNGNGCVGHFP